MGKPVNILVVTFYFRPDLSAGSFRAVSLVDALRAAAPPGSRIDVMTTQPNRYNTFSANAASSEQAGDVRVERFQLPAHSQDMLGQGRTFLSFARAVRRATQGRQYDLIFATSSRLMTAFLGAQLARRTGAPLYLDIRDIFVDTIGDILPKPVALPIRVLFGALERWTIRRADKINFVSRGFEKYFRDRYPDARFSWFTNGIDDEFLSATATAGARPARDPAQPLHVLYAGNIGEGQGLHLIVPELAAATAGRMRFTIIGDGGKRAALEERLAASGVSNVTLCKPMPRDRLIAEYRAADVLFLHLNAHRAFEKVLPSKIFEYAAMGKPVWAGVAGYAAKFLREEVTNAAVFNPCDAKEALRVFEALSIEDAARAQFVERFTRTSIAREMAKDVLGLLDTTKDASA